MAESLDEQLTLADIYAEALFSLAQEAGTVDTVRAELEQLTHLDNSNPAFAAFLRSAAVDDDHRAASFERMFRGRLSDLVLNTLQIMNTHGRVHLLSPLRRAFELRRQRAARQVEVIATSAVELNNQQKSDITTLAADISGLQPIVSFRVDPGIIGGLVLQVGDFRFDNSLRRHLLTARGQLLERGQRGLEAVHT